MWNNKSITSCLYAQPTLAQHAPAVTVKTDKHISKPTLYDFDPKKNKRSRISLQNWVNK